jgi:hypothetical protein
MKYLLPLIALFFVCSCNNPKAESEKSDEQTHSNQATGLVFPKIPEKMQFAGQTIILKDEDLRERLDREILVIAYYQSQTSGYFKRANRYFPQIEQILKEEGIPDDFKYLAVIESGLQQAVSPVGAQGFWQFMPTTAKLHNLEMNAEVDERLNIEKSTRAACEFLKQTNEGFNDWVLTSAGYNRGPAGVRSDMAWQGTEHYFDTDQNSETGRYVFRILAMKLIMENPEAYGYYPKQMELYEPIETKKHTVSSSIPDLSEWALQKGFNIKILRKLNPWLLTTKLTVNGKSYQIELPAKSTNLKPYKAYL